MAQQLLDRYIAGSSVIHALDARVKLVLTIALIVCASLLPVGAWLALTAFTALVWAAIIASGVGLPTILRRSLLALPFLLVVVTVIFSVPGRPIFRLPLGFVTLTATDAGLLRFITIVWKSWISMQAALLLTATTHFLDVLRALQALHMPKIIVALMSFMYRYLFILVEEAQRLLRARDCRSAALQGSGGGSLLWRAQVTGRLVGTLFLRSFERSERIYVAMLSRGYTGELRSLRAQTLDRRDLRVGLVVGAILLIITAQAFVG
ncbi:MAG: cobalt ECF transporter T component CbiQ [Chloroflexi bacterium]|nr:cobalt ECF transporter T component CbiQ [Chloroflexota bacterium]